ncbi:hypothetical protein TrLO_g14636 [Triparma laevis f. longispina]|uniref:Cytochrome b5 heme-binding domain-containing protein n=1 Tax=Triparma laevis f. longispina TaxID=1714387 RepID=A0A9W7AVF9_9STRA|nr:hypothetical protein TrLO_g14636 [Triparma laevis f. longispina]
MFSSFTKRLTSSHFRAALILTASTTLAALTFPDTLKASQQQQQQQPHPSPISYSTLRTPTPSLPPRPGAKPKPNEPVYTRSQVALNDGTDNKPTWVTYLAGVYDISSFKAIHPGGHIIGQAAGADVGGFWEVWAHHHHSGKVGGYLEELRIGRLVEGEEEHSTDDPYDSEPIRDPSVQTIFMERPYCSETPNKALNSAYLTSPSALYVRNHAPVPECAWEPEDSTRESNVQNHEVCFERVQNGTSPTLKVSDLQSRFGTVTVTSILQCAGNRAGEDIKNTGDSGFTGTPLERITVGMLGNAQWSGIRLSSILPALYPEQCGKAKEHGGGEWHVVFEGADGYEGSTPLARVLDPRNDCILATHMNGEPLSPDHGYPMRALLPGIAGARNVKWLQGVSLSKVPVDAPWNEYYYKNSFGEQIQQLPLQSIILNTTTNSQTNKLSVSGVAYSGGSGNAIARVEISTDGGKTWSSANIKNEEIKKDQSNKSFGWVRWSANVSAENTTEVCCRATDSEGKTQCEISPKQRGYIYNGWSKVEVI